MRPDCRRGGRARRAEAPGAPLGWPARGVPVRRSHPRRARAPAAPRECPRRAGLRAAEPARDGQGRAVRPLLALPGHAAPALPRGVRRLARRLGRSRLGRRGGSPGGRALRAHLRRLRRRLRRPARGRPRRLRVGLQRADQGAPAAPARRLPRAVHALHRLRRADARRAGPRLSLLPRPRARTGVRGGDGLAVRDLLAGAARGPRVGRGDLPAPRGRVARRPRARGRGQGAGPAARPAARRVACRTWGSTRPARPTSSSSCT